MLHLEYTRLKEHKRRATSEVILYSYISCNHIILHNLWLVWDFPFEQAVFEVGQMHLHYHYDILAIIGAGSIQMHRQCVPQLLVLRNFRAVSHLETRGGGATQAGTTSMWMNRARLVETSACWPWPCCIWFQVVVAAGRDLKSAVDSLQLDGVNILVLPSNPLDLYCYIVWKIYHSLYRHISFCWYILLHCKTSLHPSSLYHAYCFAPCHTILYHTIPHHAALYYHITYHIIHCMMLSLLYYTWHLWLLQREVPVVRGQLEVLQGTWHAGGGLPWAWCVHLIHTHKQQHHHHQQQR